MKNLFNLDSPFMQMLTRVGDMIIINFLFLVCCIPIITIGASLSATHRVMQDFMMDNEGSVVKTFFRVFKENFKQATIAWLVVLVIIVALACDAFFVYVFCQGTLQYTLFVVLITVALLVYGTVVYLFPLLTRYQNTLGQHVRNSMILMITKLPRTLGMMIFHAIPILVLWLSVEVFMQTLIFWLVIGLSFIIYMDTFLLRPVFLQLEKKS